MWVALIKLTSFLGRMAGFAFAVIALALVSLTLVQRDWMDGISIYIVVLGVISIPATLVPPYPNLIYDGFFAVAWAIAAVFSFLIMFLKSTCYGVATPQPGDNSVSCPKFQAMVAFCFLEFAAWAGCAALSLLLFLIAIIKNARERSRHNLLQPTMYRARKHDEEERTDAVAAHPIPAPVPAHLDDREGPVNDEISPYPSASYPSGSYPTEKTEYVDDKRPHPDVDPFYVEPKRPYSEEKRPYPDDKNPYPAAYLAAEGGEGHRQSAVVANSTYVEEEEEWAPEEPEYMKVKGFMADFILAHWLFLGILGVIALAIILPILFIYAVPAFALYVADHIEVPDTFYGSITGFREDYATFDVISDIRAPAGISATLEPASIHLFNPDILPEIIPLATVVTSKIKISGGETFRVYNQSVRVGNLTEWGRLWRRFFFQESMEIGAAGKLTIRAGPIRTTVDVVKTKSFQGVLNATVIQLDSLILQPYDESGANIIASVPIVNPSPLTVDSNARAVGTVLIGDTPLGTGWVDGFALEKGRGVITAKARIDMDNILNLFRNFTSLVGTELPFLGRGLIVATVMGESIQDGPEMYQYWTDAARAVKLSPAVELFPILGGLLGDTLGGFLSGDLGSLLNLDPQERININVTVINNLLRNLTIVDGEALGYGSP